MADVKVRNEIRFILNDRDVSLKNVAPDQTLLDWLRLSKNLRPAPLAKRPHSWDY